VKQLQGDCRVYNVAVVAGDNRKRAVSLLVCALRDASGRDIDHMCRDHRIHHPRRPHHHWHRHPVSQTSTSQQAQHGHCFDERVHCQSGVQCNDPWWRRRSQLQQTHPKLTRIQTLNYWLAHGARIYKAFPSTERPVNPSEWLAGKRSSVAWEWKWRKWRHCVVSKL